MKLTECTPRRFIAVSAALVAAFATAGTVDRAAASSPDPAIWVGSPITGAWPNTSGCTRATYPSSSCSLPTVHHVAYTSAFDWGTSIDDWAADLQKVSPGQRVMLYAAPVKSGYTVAAHVDTVAPACSSGNPADGGYRVTVGLYVGTIKVGTVTYAHIQPTVSAGKGVSRWGTQIGTVGNYRKNSCWTGPHVHVEMASRHNYSCASNIFAKYPGAKVSETNFIGYVGGSYASRQHQVCA